METDEDSITTKLLPLSNISKVLKAVLPEGTIMSKDVKKIMQQAGSIFILYISSIAQEISQESQGKRKKPVISPDHILQALEEMEFRNIIQSLNPPAND